MQEDEIQILIADDEAPVADVTSALVAATLPCSVQVAHDGNQLLAMASETPFDIIMTDMIMPGASGLDLIERIRQVQPNADIIVMTGYIDQFPYVRVVEAGASDFIEKPYNAQELKAKILRLARERRLREELCQEKERIAQSLRDLEQMRDARRLAEEKYQRLFELSMNGMLLLDSDSLAIQDANEAFANQCGRRRFELPGKSLTDLLTEQSKVRLNIVLPTIREMGQGLLADLTIRTPGGPVRYLDASLTYIANGNERVFLLTCTDVSAQRDEQERLVHKASTDELTGLLNKRSFQNRLDGLVSLARQMKLPLALMLIDLDNFKRCNDTYGHQIGDQVLHNVGKLIQKHMRANADIGFRYGGDEFAVVMRNTGLEGARQCAERIRAEFEANDRHGTSLSVGVASLDDRMSTSQLVETADRALYKAKAAGKNVTYLG